jgi:hypothetical protein
VVVFPPPIKFADEGAVWSFDERLPVVRAGFRAAAGLVSVLVAGLLVDVDELLPGDDGTSSGGACSAGVSSGWSGAA